VWGGPLLQLLSLGVVCCTAWVSWLRWRSQGQGAACFVAAHVAFIGSLLAARVVLMGWVPAESINALVWIPGLLAFLLLVHAGIFVDSQFFMQERDAAFALAQAGNAVLVRERTLREEQAVFFSFVAHELRSPLAVILTGVKNLENELAGVRQQALARTRRIKANAERLGDLIDRHLTLQRLDSADFLPHFSRADPRHLGDESLWRLRTLFVDRVFAFDYADGLPAWVSVDQDLLHMGLENLLINAAKFSPEGSAVALEIWADKALHLRVSDCGPGILPEHIERLFSPFQRLQQAGGAKGGFGIGLAIVRRVAQAHGGRLAYADRVGGGAVFTLTLPLACAQLGSSP
jgi:signal transduction histidine kinase